jgi:hypothetical protein
MQKNMVEYLAASVRRDSGQTRHGFSTRGTTTARPYRLLNNAIGGFVIRARLQPGRSSTQNVSGFSPCRSFFATFAVFDLMVRLPCGVISVWRRNQEE